MRGGIGRRLTNPNNGFTLASIVKHTPFLIQTTSHFSSSSSSDGAGRGRGRGSGFGGGDGGFPAAGRGQFGINRESEKANDEPVGHGRGLTESQSPGGFGHGRGRPIQSDSIPPAFSSFGRPDSPSVGRGRGSGGSDSVTPFAPEPPRHPSPPPPQQSQPHFQSQQPRFQPEQQHSQPPPGDESQGSPRPQFSGEDQPQPHSPTPPVFVKLQEMKEVTSSSPVPPPESESGQSAQPKNIFNALGNEFQSNPGRGAGRGKPPVESAPIQHEENRHIRRPQPPQQQQRARPPRDETPRPQLSREEAGRRARSELSRGEAEGGGGGVRGRGGGRGRGRGARGRGRGRGGDGWRDDKKEGEAEQEALSVFVGDSADGEKFAQKMGTEMMKTLAEEFEDVCVKALPSTANDALVDAYDTNMMIEYEPEYLMPDFGSNPDIDEKPPMSLRECLEKVKPFIVAYEGIKDQEEWEEAINEVMAQAPLIKKIVDHYSGPDRVTAMTQNEELDRIATTIPKSAPDSVKRFADRAALSLKSNPGWGFDKKYQFMDKLVLEASQSYK
uniref:Hydroxyproline-rich glycoprotein family protein n=1 Tax=Noccaea caerulescens TaxID=107243 RepID=A0A1J3FIE4_NOCCA